MKIIKISLIFALTLIILSGCTMLTGTKSVYQKDSDNFDKIAEEFLGQDKINNLAVTYGSNKTWDIVNNCSRHGEDGDQAPWSCMEGKYPNETTKYLSDLDLVLQYQNIDKDEYNKFSDFLKNHNLRGMGKSQDGQLVDLEGNLSGLRYFKDTNNHFEQNREYTFVEKINDHWYAFDRDWN